MKEQETVKQHFVPRTYLKHFGSIDSGQEKLYRSHRDDPDPNSPRLEAVANVCFQKHLYTLDGESVGERMALEDFYRVSVEEDYNTLREILVKEGITTISEAVRGQVLHTVATMLMRTTKTLAQSNQLMGRVLEQMLELCLATGKDTFDFEGTEISVKGKTLDELKREFRTQSRQGQVLTQLRAALQLANAKRDDFGILIITIDEAAGDFITSDNPVVVWTLDRNNSAFNPGASLRLPIGPKHMLCLMPGTHDILKHAIVRWHFTGEQAKLDRMSVGIMQQNNSERWIMGSQVGLQQHIRERVAIQLDLDNPTPDTKSQGIATRMKRLGLL